MMRPYRAEAFTRARIHACASGLGIELTDQEQWAFLQSEDTLDLQAAPGSGKTSLIGLKLLVLADHWTSATRGVCVLSHTNTAKDEIIARISDSTAGARLRHYPHFIGTIQSFTSTFLALPHLRGLNTQVQVVDDETYARQAKSTLASDPTFRTLKSFLSRQQYGEDLVADAEFRFEAGQLIVRSSREPRFGVDSASGRQFTDLKYLLARQGIFRYADMFALAELHLFRRPSLARAVAHRFPFVLIDEMQDTSALQQKLLDQVFGDSPSIVQRVGDVNQRIFSAGASLPSFPGPYALELPVSRRFGSTVAALASSLTVHRPQHIRGTGCHAGTIAVLLYDENSVTRVIPAFERIAAEVIPHSQLRDRPPRVLAARLRPGTSKKFPKSLACYAPEFATPPSGDQQASLLLAARTARAQWRSEAAHTAVDLLWEAVRAAARSATKDTLPTVRCLSREAQTPGARMRSLLLEILSDPIDDETSWYDLMDRMTGLLSELTSHVGSVPIMLGEHAHYVAPATGISVVSADEQKAAVVEIVRSKLGSIQSAKGETHTATLILECLNRSGKNHDVHEVLSLLATNGDLKSATSTVRDMAQLIFVGATRPTQLLAFAVHRDRASSYAHLLASNGWVIHDLAAINAPEDP